MRTAASNAVHPFLVAFTAVMLSACGASNQRAEAPAPAEPVARASPAEVYAAAGKALEACKDGEHYLAQCSEGPLAKMREAAAAGHVQAQYEFGSKFLSWLYMKQAPDSNSGSDRQAYCGRLDAAGPGDTGWARAALEGVAGAAGRGAAHWRGANRAGRGQLLQPAPQRVARRGGKCGQEDQVKAAAAEQSGARLWREG